MKTKRISVLLILMFCFVKSCQVYEAKHQIKLETKKPEVKPEQYKVTATMYYAVPGQCDESPLVTACGYKINPDKASEHKWIAVSRDLLKKFKYGDKVRISNAGDKDGIYTIADTMNKRYKNKIDFLETKDVKLYKLHDVIIVKITDV